MLMQCPNTCSAFGINDVLYLSRAGYETKSNRAHEKNYERFHAYVPAMSPHPRLRLSWEQKNEILVECERRNVTGNLDDVSDIFEWAVNQPNLPFPLSRMNVRQIINDAVL